MKKLKCIKEVTSITHVAVYVTLGKIYYQDEDYDDCDDYYILDDSGKKQYYDKWVFEEIN